ncbi:hypothetical protein [Sorangium sp. So ce363]|uniref:hypothetical protein n=1 Tax=Sorangium sp. So ce363 TaxID=3133304 RepID=UPI003F61BE0A
MLPEDGIFRSLDNQILSAGADLDFSPATELDIIVEARPESEDTDLRHHRQVEDVRAASAGQGVAKHLLIHLEVRAEQLRERAHMTGHHRDDQIDIVRRARLTLEGAREAAADEVLRSVSVRRASGGAPGA